MGTTYHELKHHEGDFGMSVEQMKSMINTDRTVSQITVSKNICSNSHIEAIKRQSLKFDRFVQLLKEKNGLIEVGSTEVVSPSQTTERSKIKSIKMSEIVKKLKKMKQRKDEQNGFKEVVENIREMSPEDVM